MEGQRSFPWLSFEKRAQAPELKSRASNKGVQVRKARPQANTRGARGGFW